MKVASTKFRLKLKKILYITLAWVILMNFQVVYDYLVVINFTNTPEIYNFWSIYFTNLAITFIGGVLAGVFIINKVEPWLRKYSLWKVVGLLFSGYTILGFILITIGSIIYQSVIYETSPFDSIVQKEVILFLLGVDFLKFFVTWGLVFIASAIGLMVYDQYGPGNFRNLILGKYFHPRTEQRIFMFLDIRSSTTIAEQLGDYQFFNFIHDFINDATDAILYTRGEIYQYIGDEIVISWTIKNGISDANCIQCFFAIQKAINESKDYYLNKYGILPEFKAGLHYGKVISGEIGTIKKEIAFSGDVLNTASRIQSECNKHQVNLLISDALLGLLPLTAEYEVNSIGNIQLRGKSEGIRLSTVLLRNPEFTSG